jgi:hypothetical protein
MRKLFLIVIVSLASALPIACQAGASLSEGEKALIADLGFDKLLMARLQPDKRSEFKRLENPVYAVDPGSKGFKETKNPVSGLECEVAKGGGMAVVSKYRPMFKKGGYLLFLSDDAFGMGNDKVAAIKSADQFDILVAMQTDGINYDIDNAAVLAKLKAWNAKYPFEIVGAGLDWMEARFVKRPADMLAFAEEVYEFCPDVVDQGTDTVKALAAEMKRTNTLYLWWD